MPPQLEGAPTDASKKLAELERDAKAWSADHDRILGAPASAVEQAIRDAVDGNDTNHGGLWGVAEQCRIELLELLDRRVRLHHSTVAALRGCVLPFETAVGDCKAGLEKARQTARKKLTAAGAGVETMMAWPNRVVAERQFVHAIGRTAAVIEAKAALTTAQGRLHNTKEAITAFERLTTESTELLREAAEGAARI